MKITKDWLDKNISCHKFSYQLSCQQMQYLRLWFPESMREPEGNVKLALAPNWIKKLIGKEVTEEQTELFYKASYFLRPTWNDKKEKVKALRDAALEQCQKLYGVLPDHPHNKFIICIGKVADTEIKKIIFDPDSTTTVLFSYIVDGKERYFKAVCAKGPLSFDVKPYVLDTKLYEAFIDNNGVENDVLIKDCTGLEIRECISELNKKKKIVIKRKKVTTPAESAPTEVSKPRIIVRKKSK